MLGQRKYSTPEVRGNERFFFTKFFFIFDFGHFFEKITAAPPGSRTVSKKFDFWSTQKCSKVSKTCSASAVIYF